MKSDLIKQWKALGEYFDFEGHQVFHIVQDDGQGDGLQPVLLLIHGFPTSSYDWHLLWNELAKSFRLVTLDMLGFGFSDKPFNYDYSIVNQANIIQAILKRYGVATYHIMAHDYGDTVAQELLARDKETNKRHINSVILLNGGLFPETHRPLLIQKLLMGPLGAIIARMTSYAKFRKNFDNICAVNLPESEVRAFWELIQVNRGLTVMPKLIRYMRERVQHRERWVSALVDSRAPIRLINGLGDPISGHHMVERYRQLVLNADVVGLNGIGHYPQVESPNVVTKSALEFWDRLSFIG